MKLKTKRLAFLGLVLVLVLSVLVPLQIARSAVLSKCENNYLGNILPEGVIYNQEICYHGFSVLYSYSKKSGLISAELLTKSRVDEAKLLPRVDTFHPDLSIPASYRSNLSDYYGSGYDRGHLSPDKDMPNKEDQFDSFSLANMSAQNPGLNRGPWAQLEKYVRNIVDKYGDTYVETGTIYLSNSKRAGSVIVPDFYFKHIYVVKTGMSTTWVGENKPGGKVVEIGNDALESKYGIKINVKVTETTNNN